VGRVCAFQPALLYIGLVILIFDIRNGVYFSLGRDFKGAGPFVLVEMVIFSVAILVVAVVYAGKA